MGTGGKKPQYHKKRKYDMGRQMAMTKIGSKRVHSVRVRGGNTKFRAMRLDSGNFSWGSEVCTRKTRILDVVYNASNNELVRTKTLVKNAIVQIDATPFRQWYEAHYGVEVSKKKTKKAEKEAAEKAEKGEAKQSKHFIPPRPVRSLRWLRGRGQGAGLLRPQAVQEEVCQIDASVGQDLIRPAQDGKKGGCAVSIFLLKVVPR